MKLRRSCLLIASMVLCAAVAFIAAPAQAIQWQEKPLLSWENIVFESFDRNDYNKVIELATSQTNDPNGNAPLFMYYAHAQKYYLEKSQASAVYFKQQYNAMLLRLSGSNLAVLTRLASVPQTSWNRKVNGKFLEGAFTRAGNEEYLGAVLFYLTSSNADVAKGALKGVRAMLQRKREIVMNGGTLNQYDRAWMSDQRLLKLLIRMSGETVNPVAGFMSKLPAFARKKAIGGAPACLALIEDPALPLLREAAGLGNANAASAIQLIQDARGERLARYPNSTWYSATGN